MAKELVPAVEASDVSAQKPLHSRHEIGLGRLDYQMEMIVHQAPRMHLPIRLPHASPMTQCRGEGVIHFRWRVQYAGMPPIGGVCCDTCCDSSGAVVTAMRFTTLTPSTVS